MPAELHGSYWVCSGIEMSPNVRDPRVGPGYGWIITHDFTAHASEAVGETIKALATRNDLSPAEAALWADYAASAARDGAVGECGPMDVCFGADELENGVRFRMFDDDGFLYYEGRFLHAPGYNAGDLGSGLLDDFGRPNDGATAIWYECTAPDGAKVWAVL